MSSIDRICTIENCNDKIRCSGLCTFHYRTYTRTGDPNTPVKRVKGKILHGLTDTPEFKALCAIKSRCNNPNDSRYPSYGGRGITVCERWSQPGGIVNFVKDMGTRPSPEDSIDRIDNAGNYTPENCRWASKSVQSANKSQPNSTGYQGVYKNHNKWGARFMSKNIGFYYTPQEASAAYEKVKREWLSQFV